MHTWETISITGYERRPVPNTFVRQRDETAHAAIVLPGLGYTAQMPLLFYVTEWLLAQNADVLQVNYEYVDTFRELDGAARERRLSADSDAAYHALMAQRPYTRLTVVGKSLGTLAMAHLFATQTLPARTDALWLTPALNHPQVHAQMATFAGPSLLVIGTADSFYDPTLLAAIGETSMRKFVVVEGAGHDMSVGDDVIRSIQALETIMHALITFFNP
ncbi:MAG TPA: hypothetical protein PLH19_15120 [Anaerolineae bacterium]|nr:hypothetical protein [Anaerolineae bacterium]HQH39845.1 hypothetical protein [Anaerolineae bacterium]